MPNRTLFDKNKFEQLAALFFVTFIQLFHYFSELMTGKQIETKRRIKKKKRKIVVSPIESEDAQIPVEKDFQSLDNSVCETSLQVDALSEVNWTPVYSKRNKDKSLKKSFSMTRMFADRNSPQLIVTDRINLTGSPFDEALLSTSSSPTELDVFSVQSISTFTNNSSEPTSPEENIFASRHLSVFSPERVARSLCLETESKLRLMENQKPPCYNNNFYLRMLIDRISDIFNLSECEGYLFGSSNYKEIEPPHDFDILIENIRTEQDKANVRALIQCFKLQGGVVTAQDAFGNDGYKKGNRHVIPMLWKEWKIDFIVSEKTVVEHSAMMDFTVGAMYFNLKQKNMYRISSLSTVSDLKYKRLSTIISPMGSFLDDPSRIFRAIRLIACEGFHFSKKSDDAIRVLFAGEKNLFLTMKPGKLFQQVQLLSSSGHEEKCMNLLNYYGLFFKLFHCVCLFASEGGYRYLPSLKFYYDKFYFERNSYPVLIASNQSSFFLPYPVLPGYPEPRYEPAFDTCSIFET